MAFGQFQLRRDTAANWTAANPVLLAGEIGIETDTQQFKIGVVAGTAWNSLAYGGLAGPPTSLANVGSTPNAKAGSIAGNVLTLQPASTSFPGVETAADKINLNTTLGKDAAGANPSIFRPGDYATGNTYDPTGVANSTSSFSAALAAMIATGGRARYEMAPGVFKVDTAILAGFANAPFAIVGPGRGVCVLIPTSGTGDFIKLRAAGDGVEIGGFAIFNTSGTPFTANAGINTNGCHDVVIHDMQFVDLFYDVNVTGASIKCSMQRNIHFQTNGSATSVGVIVTNGAAGDTYIGPDIVMSNGGATRRRACVEIAESGHFEINQCNLTGSQYGTIADPAAGKIVAFGFINQTLNDSCTVAGMRLSAATATSTIKNIKSTASWYSGTLNAGSGVTTDGVAGGIINGITFSNDRMLNNGGNGFTHAFGTDFRWADCDMKGNSSTGTGGTSNTSDGLNVAAGVSNWSINGGKYGGTDTAITGNQRYGVFVAAGAGDFIKVSPDDLSGNTTGPISMGATGRNVSITGCPGLVQSYASSASQTVTTGATTLANVLIPKNSTRGSTTLRLTAWVMAGGTGSITFSVRAGATNDAVGAAATNAVIVSAQSAAAAAANTWGKVEFLVTITAIGGAGNIQGSGAGQLGATSFVTPTAARASGAGFLAIDTTADRYLTLASLTSTVSHGVHNATIEVVNY